MNANPGDETKLLPNGFLWPKSDVECASVVFDSIGDLSRAVGFCKERRGVVQAGGNCGVWAAQLASVFDRVWTYEPDPVNFACLKHNTAKFTNVHAINAGLGSVSKRVGLAGFENNCGAYQIDEQGGKDIIIETLDKNAWGLGKIDLIYLDIEGYELFAIIGASTVIRENRPIIAVEDKGLSERYGIPKGEVVQHIMSTFDYEVCDSYARDVVLRPRW